MTEQRDIAIRQLHTFEEFAAADELFMRVWGPGAAGIGTELQHVIVFAGGYVSGAYLGDELVGAAVALRSIYEGRPGLHSHIAGVTESARGLHVGSRLKLNQREWAAAQGIEVITWTFDPLVRRNAWFNLGRLGAQIAAYEVNFYGEMSDSINAGDESDRVVAVWEVDLQTEAVTAPAPGDILVSTPEDIESLRRASPHDALQWRHHLRAGLSAAANAGQVVGFTRGGDYIIRPTATEHPHHQEEQ